MGLPQSTIELCLKYKTDISSQVHHMGKKIKESAEYQAYEPGDMGDLSPGPLDPNCLIAEDDFSPNTVATGAHTNSRLAHRARVRSLTNDNFQTLSLAAAK